MRLFDQKRVLSNMWIATRHLCPDRYQLSLANLKISFHEALRGVQNVQLRTLEDDVYVDFNNDAIAALLVKNELLSDEYVARHRHAIAPSRQPLYARKVRAALDLIRSLDAPLSRLIRTLISTVACYNIPDTEGGTISSCVGLIYLSPTPQWSAETYAELLVHEFLHNSLFLEDMVRGVFPDYRLFEDPDAVATSTLRRTKRPYDKSYHSACVAVGLMYFSHLLHNDRKANDLLCRLTTTVNELQACDRRMRSSGKVILSDNGRQLLDEMAVFVDMPDYTKLATLLKDSNTDALVGSQQP